MKIVPVSNILIEGKHSPAGVACETSELIGKSLIAQGLARSAPNAEAKFAPAPSVETAEATPEVETASATPAKKTAAKAKA